MTHGWRQSYLAQAFLTALTMSDYHVRHTGLISAISFETIVL